MPVENTSATMRAEEHSSMMTLAQDSFSIVMTAINHAKLKGHCQVQPLHVAAALLDPPTRSIALHNACLQSLKDPSHPLKCDALDLCFKVALERLPVITDPEKCKDQGMSNALAAALKRAHANERRGTPEQSLQPLLAVKTGTPHLTISILDDPSVSRVFREAGFSSTDVKTNLEEAVVQAALATPPPPTPPSLDNTSMRRLVIPPYCGSRLDSVQLRNSFGPAPSAFVPVDSSNSHGRLLERGRTSLNILDMQPDRERSYLNSRLLRPDIDGASQFLECGLQQKRHEQHSRMLSNPLRSSASRHEADVRKIVDTLVYGNKKRNPVLLSDSGHLALLKEFSQRMTRGDVPSLRGVRCLDLPITSLSVGMLNQEAVEQRLAKLKRDVDSCMQTGGAIITVGDLQWLLEPSHANSSLVLEELQQLMSSNAYNRLWLLATGSVKMFERCQLNGHASLESLGLQPVHLTTDSSESVLQPRHGSYQQTNKNVEIPFLSQMCGGWALPPPLKVTATEGGLEKADCCPECNRKFQQECAILIKEEQTLSLRSRPASLGPSAIESNPNGLSASDRHSQLPWLHNQKDKSQVPPLVKEEENLVTQRFRELRQKWQQTCATHHSQPESFPAGSQGSSLRDHSSSPVSEIVSPPERNPRRMHPLHSPSELSKWNPQTGKAATIKSRALPPLHERMARGNIPIILSSFKPAISSVNREAEVVKRGDDSNGSPLSWMKRGPGVTAGSAVNAKLSIGINKGHPIASVGTELALGRTSVHPSYSRDLREEGEHPLDTRLQDPRSLKAKVPHSATIRPVDAESLNGLCWSLSKSVAWQKEAVGAVAATVMRCRSGEGRKTGAYARTDTWLMFLGPDRVGKREVGRALAKHVFHNEENFILVTGWPSQTASTSSPSTGILGTDSNGVKYRGQTPLDRVVEAVARKPFSVLFLEDVDRADPMFRKNLLKATGRGKLSDLNGREVSLANVILIMTCGSGASLLTHHTSPPGKRPIEFGEEKLSGLGPQEIRLTIENTTSSNVLHTRGTGWSVVDRILTEQRNETTEVSRRPPETILLFGSPMFKRKVDSISQDDDSLSMRSVPEKRCKKELSSPGKAFSLDLNLSAEENLSEEAEPCITDEMCETSDPESLSELTAKVIESARRRFPAEIFVSLDATVVFKPFNLNGLTDWVLEKLDASFEGVMQTTKVPVEIDRALLEGMVSSAWQNFSNPDYLQGWIDNVLMKSVLGALQAASLHPDAVVKLMGVDGVPLSTRVDLLPSVIQVDQ